MKLGFTFTEMEKLAALLPAMVSFHECDVQEDCTRLLPSLMAVGPKRCVVVPFFYAALFALCTGLLFEGTSETSFNFAQDQRYLLVAAAVAFGAALVIGALNSARWFQLTGVAAKDAGKNMQQLECNGVAALVTQGGVSIRVRRTATPPFRNMGHHNAVAVIAVQRVEQCS